jgi:hypothetical protein
MIKMTLLCLAAMSAARMAHAFAPMSLSRTAVSRLAFSRPNIVFAATKHTAWGQSMTPLYMSSSSKSSPDAAPKVPIVLLSGFLGAGKTCTLQHLLENTDGVKIGIIVNDVASVNIDAKLVSSSMNGVVELQNGCACCSLADELLTSVDLLLGNHELDAVVVELSGVADPVAIQAN